MGPSIIAGGGQRQQQQNDPPPKQPEREDPEIELARRREESALRKQRGRSGTLLAGAIAGDNSSAGALPNPIGGANSGARLLGV